MRYLKAGLIGGIILFIWSAISWMALPWHEKTLHHFQSDTAVAQIIRANAPTSGMYLSPNYQPATNQAAAEKPTTNPPMIFASIRLEGMPTSMSQSMLVALITQIIAATFVAWMLCQTTLGYLGRLTFVLIFALAAGLVIDIPYWNWFAFDTQYTLIAFADLLIGWFLAGLVLATICKRKIY